MSKLGDFFLGFKKRYDEQVIRNKRMDEWLDGAHESCTKIDGLTNAVDNLTKDVEKINNKVDHLQEHIDLIDGRLEIIGKGTKMELLDTLYNWKKMLAERGWKTKEEMKEIKEIYELYHESLKGNGQGTQYYKEIEALPEREIQPNN